MLRAFESVDNEMKHSNDMVADRGYKVIPRSLSEYFVQRFDIRKNSDQTDTTIDTDDNSYNHTVTGAIQSQSEQRSLRTTRAHRPTRKF